MSAGWRGEVDECYASIVGGLAGVIFGILALAWPDVTVLVVALLVGPVAIVYGGRRVLRSLRVARPANAKQPGRGRVWLHGLRATAALLFALLLVLISALVHRGSPNVTAFYTWSKSPP